MLGIRLLRILIGFFIVLLACSICVSAYLYNIQKEMILETNVKNITKRVFNIEVKNQLYSKDFYVFLPEKYGSEEIDTYIQELGEKHNLILKDIKFAYNHVVYKFERVEEIQE